MKISAYIALGSNLGDRRDFLERALAALRSEIGIEVIQVSSFYETRPVGGPAGQGNYLNAVAQIRANLSPTKLLRRLSRIERSLGRVRRERFGPRTIDLDLLLADDLVHQDADLVLPHPRLHERRFVLEPLVEIAPNVMHPVLGKTMTDLLHALADQESHHSGQRDLEGLKCLVTGSTRGIGRAIALELGRAGANVLIHGRQSEPANEVMALIEKEGNHSGVLLGDFRVPSQCREIAGKAWSWWAGGLDIWVNNAGADTLTGKVAKASFEKKLSDLLSVDVLATIFFGREIGQLMKTKGQGVILNIGWDQAETGMAGDSGQLFAITKGAIMAFSQSLAVSLAPEVRVNCLAPGWIRTAWGESASEAWQQRVRDETPLGRWGTPQDVAAAARWLVSPQADFITGQIIRVNGGAVR